MSTSSPSTQPDPMSSSTASSFIMADLQSSTSSTRSGSSRAPSSAHHDEDDNSDVDSLPSISSSILDGSSEDSLSDAQREWEASLEQLQLLLTMIVLPFAGKFLGRKFAYWSWARYMEWMHNVEIRWTSKTAFNVAGAAEAAATL
ncbi:hypothetical protein VTJ49DRAFT_6184 [Mycothermus thermophilus]|uniref:Uncharacterized protein n=1 Tax=Humicola insolens TaxID=85995 RepID=A0ABR3VJF4_HUMIN